jgi:hypothetical protein
MTDIFYQSIPQIRYESRAPRSISLRCSYQWKHKHSDANCFSLIHIRYQINRIIRLQWKNSHLLLLPMPLAFTFRCRSYCRVRTIRVERQLDPSFRSCRHSSLPDPQFDRLDWYRGLIPFLAATAIYMTGTIYLDGRDLLTWLTAEHIYEPFYPVLNIELIWQYGYEFFLSGRTQTSSYGYGLDCTIPSNRLIILFFPGNQY